MDVFDHVEREVDRILAPQADFYPLQPDYLQRLTEEAYNLGALSQDEYRYLCRRIEKARTH
ncbi:MULTISPECIES: hypothetical protein [Pseudomonadaceae]|uniref:hypothetical protein n=1 Tax=Pseudomonadaceae TaxID=135621 RepID=UPI00190AD3B5|nr:hypothetical protein [Stutzerimonas frequens]MBK3757051.1 hypothetical protein [Stutzerimonas frequens]MBK3871661.1 hypothetical protein [Stutzerimonas frequens]MBK3909996.1 hypothetical protein [Stutzerimonas frequens]MBK3928435.1 hypothetical protein [Stutzerimonas frequens]